MQIALKNLDDGSVGRIIFDDEVDLVHIYEKAPYSLKVIISSDELDIEEDDIVGIKKYIEENSSIHEEGVFIGRFVDVRHITFYYYVPNHDASHYVISGDQYDFKVDHSKDPELEIYLRLYTQLFAVNEKLSQFRNSVPGIMQNLHELGFDLEKEITFILTFYSAKKDPSLKFATLLEKMGLKVERQAKRTLLFWKGYELKVELTDTWDIGLLRDKVEQISVLGEVYETMIEDFYAKEQ